MEEERSGISPERRLFWSLSVMSRVKLERKSTLPRMLLSERSRRRRDFREDISGGISPEKSLPAR